MIAVVDIDFRLPQSNRPELTLAYAGGTVVVHYKAEYDSLTFRLAKGDALHLLLELREALADLNTEDIRSED